MENIMAEKKDVLLSAINGAAGPPLTNAVHEAVNALGCIPLDSVSSAS